MGGTFIIPPGGSTANTIAPNLAPVLDNTIATPPVSPNDGDSYIIAATATGVWTGLETQIATWNGSSWVYYIPVDDDTTTVTTGTNAGKVYEFNTGVWTEVVAPTVENTPFYLAGTTIDAGSNKTSDITREGRVVLGGNGSETTLGYLLRLISKAVGGIEKVLRAEVSDATGFITLENGTGAPNIFTPLIRGYQEVAVDRSALVMQGQIGATNDTGVIPIVSLGARRTMDFVQTRPLLRFSNFTTIVLQIEANGDVHIRNGKLFIETVTSGSTATEVLMHNSVTKEVESMETVTSYITDAPTKALLEDLGNWSDAGAYTGTAITGTFQGQNHVDATYKYEAVDDNVWIRLIRGKAVIDAYISDAPTEALLEDVANWDINGVYTGTAITGTFMGQKHYNGDYFFEAVDNNLWIRLIRG